MVVGWCYTCNKGYKSESSRVTHFGSNNHKYNCNPGLLCDKILYQCNICKTRVYGPNGYNDHKMSKRHKLCLKEMEEFQIPIPEDKILIIENFDNHAIVDEMLQKNRLQRTKKYINNIKDEMDKATDLVTLKKILVDRLAKLEQIITPNQTLETEKLQEMQFTTE